MIDVEALDRSLTGLFPEVLGVRFLEAAPERLRARLRVRDDLCTVPGIMHGGAIMAFADTLGGVATALNLPDGAGTTTIESKTNFLAAARAGTTIEGECTPLHRGRRTMVWQTRVTSADGKLLALVTQTQAVLERAKEPMEVMTSLFAGKSAEAQERLLAVLERGGAAVYRALAASASSDEARTELLRAAEREDANAEAMDRIVVDEPDRRRSPRSRETPER
jgi:1,4-dihydroxy-2-naphthoyl-CoA hydrolase